MIYIPKEIVYLIADYHDYDKYYKIPSKIKKYAKFINFSKEYNYNYDRDKDWMGYPAGSGPIGINRILCLINTPFKYTLHLDCDTIINNSENYNYIDFIHYHNKEKTVSKTLYNIFDDFTGLFNYIY